MTALLPMSTLVSLSVLTSVAFVPAQLPCDGWTTRAYWEAAGPAAVGDCLSAGYGVDDRSAPSERTPLHWAAAFSDDPEVISVLVEAGASLRALTRGRRTPLHMAARYNGNLAIIRALVEYEADVHAENIHGRTPLHIAALYSENPAVVDELAGVTDINVRKHNGGTPLHDAARRIRDGATGNPNPAIVDVLIRRGADLSVETEGGLTPARRARDERLAAMLQEEEARREAIRARFLQAVAARGAVGVFVLGVLGVLVARFRRRRSAA